MQIGQFLYGMLNGSIERIQTPNVDKLLSEESLTFLYDLGRHDRKRGEFVYTWEKENAISKSHIESVKDTHGRPDVLNRTVIFKFENVMRDILDHTDLEKQLDYQLYLAPMPELQTCKLPQTLPAKELATGKSP